MMEAIANVVRAFPADRARSGQPFVAFELLHGAGPSGALEWSLGVRCEPRARGRARRRDQRRLPRRAPRPPARRDARNRAPGTSASRRTSCASASSAASSTRSWPPATSSPRRRWRRSRTPRSPLGAPSVVRFQLTPAPAVLRGARAPPSTAATRTGSYARSAGACPRAASPRRSTAPRWPTPSAPRTAACSGSRPSSPPTRARRASNWPPPSRPAAARTACTAAG